jgi:hypothetical protein
MTAACLILVSSVVGQYPYNRVAGYGYGYGYGRTPLSYYDPVRYNRYYEGSGYYNYAPPVIANSEIINFQKPVPTTLPGVTGLVVSLDEQRKQITLQLAASTMSVPYGAGTHFLANDGDFPVIKPGNLINVNQNTITILRRGQK